jgi:hypothetical protein
MIELVILAVVALATIVFAVWARSDAKRQGRDSATVEQQAEVLEHVEIANEVRNSVPVRGAAQRVQDRYNRRDKSLLDRRDTDGERRGSTDRRDSKGN